MKSSKAAILLILALGIGLGAWGAHWWQQRDHGPNAVAASAPADQPEPAASTRVKVEVSDVQRVRLERSVSAVGTLRSHDSVVLRPEISGRIAEINFAEGGKVEKGQVLVRLDDSVARAKLQQARANLQQAGSQHRRSVELTKSGFVSRQARDEAASNLAVQQAAVALAEAELEKTAIQAPFDGLAGLRTVSVGDYVGPGTDLVPIEAIDPLNVDFRIPEQFLSAVAVGARLQVTFDAMAGLEREGSVGAISPLIDVGGRSLLLRANVPNPDHVLRPGLFARVRLELAETMGLVVPESALTPSGDAQYVYRVQNGVVERVMVQVGQRLGANVEIVSGLNEGDKVIVSGLQKVRDGTEVEIVSSSAGAAAPAASGA